MGYLMSQIGFTFPVKGSAVTISWGVVEPHRSEIQKAHGKTLEWLCVNGGLSRDELAKIVGEAALPRKKGT